MARQEWIIRFWCTKEAVAKALGRGLVVGLKNLVVKELDSEAGLVKVALRGKLAQEFPGLAKAAVTVGTIKEKDYIVAITICEGDEHDQGE